VTSGAVTNGREGHLTANEAAALSQAIGQVLDCPPLRNRLARAALRRAQNFSIEAQAGKTVTVYEQARADQRAGSTVRLAPAAVKRWRDLLPFSA
jgi:glycosyltransferase involved in cell wall biosynthesis